MSIITIQDNQLLVDGNLAGSLADALDNFPAFDRALWAGLNSQNQQLKADFELASHHLQLLADAYKQLKTDYDGLLAEHTAATAPRPQPEAAPNIITTAEFRARFTDGQLADIWRLSLTDDKLAVFLVKTFTAATIDLDADEVKAGLGYLAELGV